MGRVPKADKNPHRHKIEVSPSIPFSAQVRLYKQSNEELKRQAGKMRRLLWLAIHKEGGRIEIDESDYRAAMDTPAEDTIVGVEHDKQRKKVVLIFTDEKGQRLPESEPKLVIATDA